jgi:hypothetical protein
MMGENMHILSNRLERGPSWSASVNPSEDPFHGRVEVNGLRNFAVCESSNGKGYAIIVWVKNARLIKTRRAVFFSNPRKLDAICKSEIDFKER